MTCYTARMKDPCAICSKLISADRRQFSPHVKTCSPACSVVYTDKLRRETARLWRQRKREAGA